MRSELMGKKYTVTNSRLGDEIWSMESDDPMMPNIVYKFGEEYTYTQPIPGQAEGLTVKVAFIENIIVNKTGHSLAWVP